MAQVNILLAVSVGIISLAFIFIVIGAATDEWISHDLSSSGISSGLSSGYLTSAFWPRYNNPSSSNTKIHYPIASLLPIESYFSPMQKAAAALLILALLGSILSLCMMGGCLVQDLLGKQMEQTAVLPTLSAITGGLGATCGLAACILFGVDTAKGRYFSYLNFGYSFGLTIAGSVLLSIGAGIGKKAKKNNLQVNPQTNNMPTTTNVVMP